MKKRTLYILVLAVFIITVLLGHMVVVKMQNYLKKLDNKKFDLSQQLLHTTTEITNNREYLEKWRMIRAFEEEPLEERQTKFTAYLQSLETERNFYFTSLSSPMERQLEENPAFQLLSYDISFHTNLEELVEFLGRLNYSEKLLRIEKLEISRRADYIRYETSPPTGNLVVSMTIVIPAAKTPSDITDWEVLP